MGLMQKVPSIVEFALGWMSSTAGVEASDRARNTVILRAYESCKLRLRLASRAVTQGARQHGHRRGANAPYRCFATSMHMQYGKRAY